MKRILYGISIAWLYFTSPAFAESEVYQYLQTGGEVHVTSYGGMYVPPYMYKGLVVGQLSPFLQLNFQQHLMAQCVEKVLQSTPDQKTPYSEAHARFSNGICRISKCFQQMMILDFLAQSSTNPKANGGETDAQTQNGSKQVALYLYQASGKSGCDARGQLTNGSPSENVDPNLANYLK